MKLAVCDDNPIELKKIEALIKEQISLKKAAGFTLVSTFCSSSELLAAIQGNDGYDILILDIVMPGMSGIELAAKIREKDDACRIIFLTSSAEFAVESYKVNAYYYVLKSNMQNELPSLLQRAVSEMAVETASCIFIKEKHRCTRVAFSNIEYVESRNHTVYFHLHDNQTITSYSTISACQDILLSDARFIKCQKSFIVNMSYITSITSNALFSIAAFLCRYQEICLVSSKQNILTIFYKASERDSVFISFL